MSKRVTILAAGDVGARRSDLGSIFRGCARTMRASDLTFAQLETTISDRGAKAPNARLAMRSPPAMAAAARDAGIGLMSFAGNHCLDWGFEAFKDTLAHAQTAGVRLAGAGADIRAAREPAFVDAGGIRVALVAASSILPEGYAAGPDKPGCAPMRAHTVYDPPEPDQPGTAPHVLTFPDRKDLAALLEAIRSARRQADIVLLSLHWGIHMVEAVLADYQQVIAHAAIDAGAEAVLGHHPHILKGVEIYRGKPIFYSLGNFAIEQPHVWDPAITQTASFRHLVSLNPQWDMDSLYMLPHATRLTGLAKLVVESGGAAEIRFLPAFIEDDSAPVILDGSDPRFEEVRAYLERISKAAGFTTRFEVEGSELRLSGSAPAKASGVEFIRGRVQP